MCRSEKVQDIQESEVVVKKTVNKVIISFVLDWRVGGGRVGVIYLSLKVQPKTCLLYHMLKGILLVNISNG